MDKNVQGSQQKNIVERYVNWPVTLLLAGGIGLIIGLGSYFWQQQEVAELKTQLMKVGRVPSDDEQVVAASKAFCEASVPEQGYKIVFKMGTGDKTILYSKDKMFASVNVGCNTFKVDEINLSGPGRGYILKKVNNVWLVIDQGTQGADKEIIKKFGIPSDFN